MLKISKMSLGHVCPLRAACLGFGRRVIGSWKLEAPRLRAHGELGELKSTQSWKLQH